MPYLLQKTKPVDASELAKAIKRNVAAFDGLIERPTTLECLRLGGGAFSASETSTIDSVWSAYDKAADDAAESAERTAVQTAARQLRQAYADWDAMTAIQQLAVCKKLLRILAYQLTGR